MTTKPPAQLSGFGQRRQNAGLDDVAAMQAATLYVRGRQRVALGAGEPISIHRKHQARGSGSNACRKTNTLLQAARETFKTRLLVSINESLVRDTNGRR